MTRERSKRDCALVYSAVGRALDYELGVSAISAANARAPSGSPVA